MATERGFTAARDQGIDTSHPVTDALEIDPGACERCNCHHHTTADHDRWSREGPPDFGPTIGDDW